MFKHVEDLCNPVGDITNRGIVQLLKTSPREGAECVLRGCLCQDLHGYGVFNFISQSLFESRLVVDKIVLSRRTQHIRTIDFIHVRNSHPLPALHERVIRKVGKEGLHVMRDT